MWGYSLFEDTVDYQHQIIKCLCFIFIIILDVRDVGIAVRNGSLNFPSLWWHQIIYNRVEEEVMKQHLLSSLIYFSLSYDILQSTIPQQLIFED